MREMEAKSEEGRQAGREYINIYIQRERERETVCDRGRKQNLVCVNLAAGL